VISELYRLTDAHDTRPDADLIRSASVLFIDHLGIVGSVGIGTACFSWPEQRAAHIQTLIQKDAKILFL
jgi:hypothetical protein